MDTFTYHILQNYLPEDCILIINDYFKDILRNELNIAFRKVYPNKLEIWKETNIYNNRINHCSRLLMHHPILNRQFISIVRTYRPHDMVERYRYPHSIDKYLYIYNIQYRISTKEYHCLNRKCHILNYPEYDKNDLLFFCHENNLKVFKSWTKKRLIQALLQADVKN